MSVKGPEISEPDSTSSYRSYSQWQLIRLGFMKHKLAVTGLVLLGFFYLTAIFCDFLAPYNAFEKLGTAYAPPTSIHIFDSEGKLRAPFVYGLKEARNLQTLKLEYTTDTSVLYPITFLPKGSSYKLFGFIPASVRLFGVKAPGALMLFGTDRIGRDLFSRTVLATRVSASVGLVSIVLSLVLGLLIGSIAALAGGMVDAVVQKITEVLICIPSIPLWMGLSAALPKEWSPLLVYFAITVILALANWTEVARIVRGKFLSLRDEDYVSAARSFGAGDWHIMMRHLIPNFISFVIVSVTLSIPGAIIAETSLSFLGIGLRPPVVSWGVLLQDAQNIHSIVEYTWTLLPLLFVITIVMAFNFVGDGLRDAVDPYGRR